MQGGSVVVDWGSLVAGFGFRFRSLVNLLISGYLLAVVLSLFGIGSHGFTNFGEAAGFVGLTELRTWVVDAYAALGGGDAPAPLIIVLSVWLLFTCLVLGGGYKDGSPSNLMPNSALASATTWALWVDFVTPGSVLNWAFWAILATLVWISWSNTHFTTTDGLDVPLLALCGILTSFVYAVIAPPLWLAGADNERSSDTQFERGFNAGQRSS